MNPDTPSHVSRPRNRLIRWGRRIAVVAVLLAVVLFGVHWLVPVPEERLAALDAARTVPDEDNAALIYAELLTGEQVAPSELATAVARIEAAVRNPVSVQESRALSSELLELRPAEGISDPNAAMTVALRPWKSAECPELKQWLDKHRRRVDRLQEAARKPSCYFPVSPTAERMNLFDVPLGALRQNILLLRYAANNDFGEGDIDSGLAKCDSLLSIGRHFRMQPAAHCLSAGIACEAIALHCLAEFVVTGGPADRHLRSLTVRCQDLNDEWRSLRRDISRVRDIRLSLLGDRRPLRIRLSMLYYRIRHHDGGWLEDRMAELYHRMLSERRGLRILIELRRFNDRTGQWPKSLDEIAPSLPPQALIDPTNGGPYVYRLSGHGFLLYSIGANRIDEKGQHRDSGPDDWPIWPPRGRTPEPKQEDANSV
jgi:hypothetical protein